MGRTVTVTFDQETGNATVDLDGFQGKGCKAVAKAFADAIGTTIAETDKPELYRETSKSCLTNG